jgi:hypothetical protein
VARGKISLALLCIVKVKGKFNACCSVHLGNKGNYLFQLNVHFVMFLESFLLFAQHVLDITASIIRSTTVVYAAIGFYVEGRSI